MIIYTSTQIQLHQISNIEEPQYIENVPYSLQMKLNIPKRITIKYYKGNPCIYYDIRGKIEGKIAKKIIKVINGYLKGK